MLATPSFARLALRLFCFVSAALTANYITSIVRFQCFNLSRKHSFYRAIINAWYI